MKNQLKVLEYAMEMEKQGKEFYLRNKNLIKDSNGKDLFEELAKIEDEHYNILKKMHNSLKDNPKTQVLDITEGYSIFNKELKSSNIDLNKLSGSDMAIMRMAYIIENDFAEFYKNAAKNAENDQIKKLLNDLANWENSHRDIFYKRFKNMMQDNWFKQNFYPF